MAKTLTILNDATPPEGLKLATETSYKYEFLNPYDADTRTYPYDGKMVIVSDDDKSVGITAMWRVSRRLEGWRWKSYGEWVTPLTNVKIGFEPMYWRKFTGYTE
jgi:hypothetical protein